MSKRLCPTCSEPISGHPNKRFCNNRCKDRFHNAQPHRLARLHEMAGAGLLSKIERNQTRVRIEMVNNPEEENCPPRCDCYSCVVGWEDDF